MTKMRKKARLRLPEPPSLLATSSQPPAGVPPLLSAPIEAKRRLRAPRPATLGLISETPIRNVPITMSTSLTPARSSVLYSRGTSASAADRLLLALGTGAVDDRDEDEEVSANAGPVQGSAPISLIERPAPASATNATAASGAVASALDVPIAEGVAALYAVTARKASEAWGYARRWLSALYPSATTTTTTTMPSGFASGLHGVLARLASPHVVVAVAAAIVAWHVASKLVSAVAWAAALAVLVALVYTRATIK